MKRFLISGFIFLFILLAINTVFNSLVWAKYMKGYDEVDLTYDTFLFADSHGLAVEDFMEEYGVYNFSAASDSYFDMLRKVKYLTRQGKIKKILITVDDHTLSVYREGANNLDRSAVFANAQDFDSYWEFIKVKYIKRHIALLNPKSRNILREIIKAEFRSSSEKKKGNTWPGLSEKERNRRAAIRAQEQFPDNVKSDKLIAELLELVELGRQHKIEIIGVKFPVSESFYHLINGKSYGADSLFRANGLRVIDNTTLYLDRPDFFKDQDHLSETGGKAFSKVLSSEL